MRLVRPVGDQAPGLHGLSERVDVRELVLCRQTDDPTPVEEGEAGSVYEHGLSLVSGDPGKRVFDIFRDPDLGVVKLCSELEGGLLGDPSRGKFGSTIPPSLVSVGTIFFRNCTCLPDLIIGGLSGQQGHQTPCTACRIALARTSYTTCMSEPWARSRRFTTDREGKALRKIRNLRRSAAFRTSMSHRSKRPSGASSRYRSGYSELRSTCTPREPPSRIFPPTAAPYFTNLLTIAVSSCSFSATGKAEYPTTS
jgi:hypothetical protein